MGTLLYGKGVAQTIQESVKTEIEALKAQTHTEPTLTLIKVDKSDSPKVGELKLHANLARQLGIQTHEWLLDPSISEGELLSLIERCNHDPAIHGILVILPLPEHIRQEAVLSAISPAKEIEGLDASFSGGKQINVIAAILQMMQSVGFDIFKSRCVFISDDSTLEFNAVIKKLLGKAGTLPISLSVVTKESENAQALTQEADLLAVSLQTPELIDSSYIKEGAIVMDFNPIITSLKYCEKRGGMVPDIKSSLNVPSLLTKAKYVLPVTGGIGPVVLASLMRNFLFNYKAAVST